MGKETPIILGIIFTIVAIFIIISGAPIHILDLEGNVTITGDLNVTGTSTFGGDLNMSHNYVIESDLSHWMHFTMEQGVTDVTINIIESGLLTQDRWYHRLTFSVDEAPGVGKLCDVALSDGTDALVVALEDAETSGWTTTDEFHWDVSAENLTLTYSQTGGGAAKKGFITIKYHYMETP